MKRKGLSRLLTLAAALAVLACLLPLGRVAAAAPQLQDPNVTYLDEENALLAGNAIVAGKDAKLYIPIINRGDVPANSLQCVLPYSGDPVAFPFESSTLADVNAVPYKKFDPSANGGSGGLVDWDGTTLAVGERAWFELTGVKALTSLTQGSLQLVFEVFCAGSSAPELIKITVYVTNVSWSPPVGGSGNRSKPKVIIEAYSFDRERVYAGDKLRINLSVRNTSSAEAITNLLLTYSSDGGVLLPSSGTSNSVFLGEIKKGEAYQLVLFIDVSSGAEAKTYPLSIQLAYESARNFAEFKEETSITIPVLQRIRVRLTEPAMYGDPWVGQGIMMSFSLYNLSKSTIYNCSVEVAGEGLSLEEPFFGGNVSGGNMMRADVSVIPETAGEVHGQFLVNYENIFGEITTETLDFTLFVQDFGGRGSEETFDPGVMPEQNSAAGSFAWLWWALIGAVVLGGVIVLIVVLRKRRKKFLEEL